VRSFGTGVVVGALAASLLIGGLVLGVVIRGAPVLLQVSPAGLARTVLPASAPLVPPLVAAVEQTLAPRIRVSMRVDGTRVILPPRTVHELAASLKPTVTRVLMRDLENRRFVDSVLMPLLARDLTGAGGTAASPILVPVRIWPGFTVLVPISLASPSS
jgi:hypothetical protein